MLQAKFNEFVDVVKRLRKECPWDRKQTNDTIKAATIEEAYEVADAVDRKDDDDLKKELGDLLLHVVFHSEIAEGEGRFKLEDVIDSIQEKLIRRHPHVFGTTKVEDDNDVKRNWETIKLQEGRKSVVDGLPIHMPSLLRAYRIQEKAAKIGFDWDKKDDVWAKVIEETDELKEAEKSGNTKDIEEELGDLLFAITNYARFIDVNPEDALRGTNAKFEKRFKFIERRFREKKKDITKASLEEMDKYWEESKKSD